MEPKIVNIKSYPQFVLEVNKLGLRDWVYRGHANVDWRIEPSLLRYYRTHKPNIRHTTHDIRELDAIRKFRRGAHQSVSHLPDRNDLLSWLSLMQHFGAPTRLLDVTYSPATALYFAITESVTPVQRGENLSDTDLDQRFRPFDVHAINVESVRRLTVKRLKEAGISIDRYPTSEQYCIGDNSGQRVEFVGFFEGYWQSSRQLAQQGLFLVPSKLSMDIERFLGSMETRPRPYRNAWVVFRFRAGRKTYRNIVRHLISSGVTAANLFPGIEGLARSLYLRMYEKAKDLD